MPPHYILLQEEEGKVIFMLLSRMGFIIQDLGMDSERVTHLVVNHLDPDAASSQKVAALRK